MLNAIEKFWAAAAWSNLLNLAMIAGLLAWHWFPNAAYAAAWGVALGGVAQLIFMLWAGRHEGLRLRIVGLVWTPEVKEFFKAFGMVTFGAASVVVAPLIDFFIASLSAHRQPHRALLRRPHQPIAAGRLGHRAGHGAAAGNVHAAWPRAIAPDRTRRRTAPPRSPCCLLCRSR